MQSAWDEHAPGGDKFDGCTNQRAARQRDRVFRYVTTSLITTIGHIYTHTHTHASYKVRRHVNGNHIANGKTMDVCIIASIIQTSMGKTLLSSRWIYHSTVLLCALRQSAPAN